MNKLSSKHLRRIILEEMTRLQEEREVEAIMKRVLSEDSEGEETYHYGEDEGEDKKELDYLMHHGGGHDHEHNLEKDMEYDEDHEDRHEKGTHFRESALEEADIDATTQTDIALQQMGADGRSQADNIGENTDHLSRGSLYRRRYYGRY